MGTSLGGDYFTYDLQAAVQGSASATGGMTGSISTALLYASNSYSLYISPTSPPPDGGWAFDASAESQIGAEFTSSGPVRMGTLTITGNSPFDPFIPDSAYGGGEVTVIQGTQSYTTNALCTFGGTGNPTYLCQTASIPIELGTSFLIEASGAVNVPSVNYSFAGGGSDNFFEGATFTLQDSNGAPIESTLVTVPEPSSFAAVASLLAFLALGLMRRRSC